MVTAPRAIQNTLSLVPISNRTRDQLLKNRVFVMSVFEHISNAHYCARSDTVLSKLTEND